ncbi:MAG: type II toxin-antitoxin system HicA family toxin [Deltaproteobacteria bacterium]|nr:type II toxin-antitoxin system HicA family toxin [Deltaproteobacteria bacterium]
MTKLPQVSSRECIKALERAGFYRVRRKGSHIVLHRKDPFAQTVVPERKTLGKGLLHAILRQAGLSVNDFLKLL